MAVKDGEATGKACKPYLIPPLHTPINKQKKQPGADRPKTNHNNPINYDKLSIAPKSAKKPPGPTKGRANRPKPEGFQYTNNIPGSVQPNYKTGQTIK